MSGRESAEGTDDLLHAIIRDLSTILDILEGRVLYLMREGVRGVIAPDGVAGELRPLLRDLKACFKRLAEVKERQDLTFEVTRELQEIDQRCVWLFRKIRVQQAFLAKLNLEAQLRNLVSAEAFNIYQTLRVLDEDERDALASDDVRIRALLLEEQPQNSPPPEVTG